MFRRVLVLGLVAVIISALATVAAVRTSSDEAEAQAAPVEMNFLCLDPFTGLYRGAFTPSCPPFHQLLTLPDDYPLTLCAPSLHEYFRAPLPSGECDPPAFVRIDLPSVDPVHICYEPWTGRLKPPVPYPDGTCGTGRTAGILVSLPQGFATNADTYQTLGNVDIDVPAASGVLSNDAGPGLEVTGFQNPSDNGGTVNVNPDGSFTYIPPVPDPDAFTGTDTFTYTAEDDDGNFETVTVTIEVLNPVVWFVDADAADPGDGRRVMPFDSLDPLNNDGLDPDDPGDIIFLYEAESVYVEDFLLEDDQYLVGQEVDLAEILEAAIAASALQGLDAQSLPPFMVLPDANPTEGIPLLEGDAFIPLEMSDGSTAVGLTIDGVFDPGVLVDDAENTTLDRVEVYGGFSEVGEPGVIVDESSLLVTGSFITGGSFIVEPLSSESDSALQGFSIGNGGDGIEVDEGILTVISSTVHGGEIEGFEELGSNLQGFNFDTFHGGHGISVDFIGQITVTGSSTISGGDGSFGDFFGGDAGDGIQAGAFEARLSQNREAGAMGHSLQGFIDEGIPFIDVSGASLVEGGEGGDGFDSGGDGGDGIETSFFVVTVSEESSVLGGDGGSGDFDGGDGGFGILTGAFAPSGISTGSSLLGLPEDLTFVGVDSSTISGGDGGEAGVFAGAGGEGIIAVFDIFLNGQESSLQGVSEPTALDIDVANSTITGGDGADAVINAAVTLQGNGFSLAGDGGFGIVVLSSSGGCCPSESTLQGPPPDPEVSVNLNVAGSSVAGGAGGGGGTDGGWGGLGIAHGFFPFFFGASENESETRRSELLGSSSFIGTGDLTVIDSTVTGGPAGSGEEYGGYGGIGIFSTGINFFGFTEGSRLLGEDLNGPITTVSNSIVTGGNGGAGEFAYSESGGEGIIVLGAQLVVNQGSQVTAGDGADSDNPGYGGAGVIIEFGNASIQASTVTGGNAGDGEFGADGGPGIVAFEALLDVGTDSTILGGNGGSGFEGGRGGNGILMEYSIVSVTGSQVDGGDGGDSAINGASARLQGLSNVGGAGGDGIGNDDCFFCNTLTVDDAIVRGGAGGAGDAVGLGGNGVHISNDDVTITNSLVNGGASGSGALDPDSGHAIFLAVTDGGTYSATILNNQLNGRTGGGNPADSLLVQVTGSGSICVDARGNTPLGGFTLDNGAATGTLGITQASTAAMSADNNGVAVNPIGTISFNCASSSR